MGRDGAGSQSLSAHQEWQQSSAEHHCDYDVTIESCRITMSSDPNALQAKENEKEDRRLIGATPSSEDVVVSPSVGVYTFEQGLEAAGMGLYQKLLLVYVGFAWVCDSMEMMLLSFLAPAASCEWGLSAAQKGLITSVVFIGMLVGAYLFGMLADSEGRKIGFLSTAVFTAIWGFASAGAPNYIALIVFRSMVGLGLGGIHVAFSLFLEFVPTESRGRYAILLQGFWTVGALLEAGTAWIVLPTLGWRYLLAFSTIPLVVLLLFYPLISESPRFLSMRGKTLKAERILERIARWNGNQLPNGKLGSQTTPPHHSGNKDAAYHAKKVAKGMTVGVRELFSGPLRNTTLLLFVTWFVNALIYYGLVLLTTELQSKDTQNCTEDGKLDLDRDAYLEIFIDTFAEVLGFGCAFFAIDRYGRRLSMLVFFCICGMAMWPIALSTVSAYQTTLLFIARAGITGAFLVVYVYTPELFPTDVRAFGMGVCTAWSRVGGLVAPLFSVQLVDSGYETVVEILFAVLCFSAAIATSFIPVETMGRDLKDTVEIQMIGPQQQLEHADVIGEDEIERL